MVWLMGVGTTSATVANTQGDALARVALRERVQALDVLRGVSLPGILTVNILDDAPKPTTAAERLTEQFVVVPADGSSNPLF